MSILDPGVLANGSLICTAAALRASLGLATTDAVVFASVTASLTGNVTGNLTGNVTGNASTATALQTARTISGTSFDGTANITIAHSGLSGLTSGDDHTQYALLAGRSTPQTFAFGTASGATAGYLTSTAHATKGSYSLNAAGTIVVDEANARIGIRQSSPTSVLHIGSGGVGALNCIINIDAGSTGQPSFFLKQNGTLMGVFGIAEGTNALINGSAIADFCIRSANNQRMLWSADGGTTAHLTLSYTGTFGINMVAPTAQFHSVLVSSSRIGQIIQGIASQTGVLLQLQGVSSTTTRSQAEIDTAWVDSTDATRKAALILRAYDTAVRETARGWGDGAGRFAITTPASAPTDAHIQASQVSFYLDEAGNNLKIRAKYADGTTLKTATIALA